MSKHLRFSIGVDDEMTYLCEVEQTLFAYWVVLLPGFGNKVFRQALDRPRVVLQKEAINESSVVGLHRGLRRAS